MRTGQAEYSNTLAFGRAILGAVRDESLGTVPFFTIGFNAHATVHQHVDVAGTRDMKLCLDPKPSAHESDPAERLKPGLGSAVNETQNFAEAVRCPFDQFDQFVVGDESLIKSGFHTGQGIQVVEARQCLQHSVKR